MACFSVEALQKSDAAHIKRDTKDQPQNDEIDKRKLRKVFGDENFRCKIPDVFSSCKITLVLKKLLWMGKQVGKHLEWVWNTIGKMQGAIQEEIIATRFSTRCSCSVVVSFCRKVSHNLWYSLWLSSAAAQCKLEWKRIRIRSGGRDNERRSKIP